MVTRVQHTFVQQNLKDSLNAVRQPLTQHTVLNCVSHFNLVIAKRAVAEKMMFMSGSSSSAISQISCVNV